MSEKMSEKVSEEESVVYFSDTRATNQRSLLNKLDDLYEKAGGGAFKRGYLVAVKLHFGEYGNTSYLRTPFVGRVVEKIKDTGAKPFVTDTNTLYIGTRMNTVDHIQTAARNGFDLATVGAPVVIADGLRGESKVAVSIDGGSLETVSIGREIVEADGLVVMTHFKCHELTGFGGAIKNTGMGCASREGKLTQHSGCPPVVDSDGCTACSECATMCPADAIDIKDVAFIVADKCTGCSHCVAVCPEGTIKIQWVEAASRVQEKMAEHAVGAVKGKEGKCVYINFINQVSPLCDCYGHTDAPIVPDIGIVASTDPVAIDQASADLVNKATGFEGSSLKTGHEPGGDKFRGVHPTIDWEVQLEYGEKMGLGRRRYRLEEV